MNFAKFAKFSFLFFECPFCKHRSLHPKKFCYDVTKTSAVRRRLERQAWFYRAVNVEVVVVRSISVKEIDPRLLERKLIKVWRESFRLREILIKTSVTIKFSGII